MIRMDGPSQLRRLKSIARLPVRAAHLALDNIYDVQHTLSERCRRMPNPWRECQPASGQSARDAASVLRESGVLVLPQFISGVRIKELQFQFDRMVEQIRSSPDSETRRTPSLRHFSAHDYQVDAHSETDQMTQTRDPFKYSPLFLGLALDSFVLDVAQLYFGRPVAIQNADCRRLYSMPPRDFGFFNWHHDARGRKLNVMFLLTDTTATDQRLTYVTGSHRMVHSLKRCLCNSYSSEEIDRKRAKHSEWKVVECAGPAGTLVLFDGNGLHRGNRNLGAVRDTLMTRFMSDQRHCWHQRIPRADFDQLSAEKQTFLLGHERITIDERETN